MVVWVVVWLVCGYVAWLVVVLWLVYLVFGGIVLYCCFVINFGFDDCFWFYVVFDTWWWIGCLLVNSVVCIFMHLLMVGLNIIFWFVCWFVALRLVVVIGVIVFAIRGLDVVYLILVYIWLLFCVFFDWFAC